MIIRVGYEAWLTRRATTVYHDHKSFMADVMGRWCRPLLRSQVAPGPCVTFKTQLALNCCQLLWNLPVQGYTHTHHVVVAASPAHFIYADVNLIGCKSGCTKWCNINKVILCQLFLSPHIWLSKVDVTTRTSSSKQSEEVALWRVTYLLVELGGEKRSMAGAETGDESVVAVPTFFWSSLRRWSYNNTWASVSSTEGKW